MGLKFLQHRHNPEVFEPAPSVDTVPPEPQALTRSSDERIDTYSVKVNGIVYEVEVGPQEQLSSVQAQEQLTAIPSVTASKDNANSGEDVAAPLAGNIFQVLVQAGSQVQQGDVLVILEAMKMETEIRAAKSGTVQSVYTKEGNSVTVGEPLLSLA